MSGAAIIFFLSACIAALIGIVFYQPSAGETKKSQSGFPALRNFLKKMLSNISHDIKTPMTVILGYLEIMRLNAPEENEMLLKVEQKAQRVVELINQFFTLAKLEAGDMDIEISKIDICEICRENVLDFVQPYFQCHKVWF